MKPTLNQNNLRLRRSVGCVVILFIMLVGLPRLRAQATLYWDANGNTAGVGGTGTWDTSTSREWSTSNTGSVFSGSGRWTNSTSLPDNAVFLGTVGTVTTGGAVQVGNITFGVSGYTLAGTASNSITLGGTSDTAVTIDTSTFNATISGVLAGAATVTKLGTGSLYLSGANTYTAATTISAGVINIENNAALGTAAGNTTVTSGAALEVQGGLTAVPENLTLNGTGVSNNGALRNISGNNTLSGAITLGSAAEIQSDAGTLTLSSGGITGTQNLTLSGAGNTTISGVIGIGSGTLTKNDGGTLTLSGANTYTGVTTITAGVLNLQNAAALGTTAGGTSVTSGAELQLQGGIAVGAEALTINGTGVSSTGALRNISGTNSYAGAITLGSAARINSDAGVLTLSGGITGTQNLTVGGAGNTTASGVVGTGTGTVTKDGAGTVTLSGANTYTGATSITAGTLQLGVNNALPNSTAITIASGATFGLNNFSDTIGSIAGVAGSTVTLGSGTLTAGSDNTSTSFAGVVSGTGGLTKSGTGTLTLTGANTYSGITTIGAGTLQVGNAGTSGTLGTGNVTNNGALVFNRTDALTVANVLSGAGSLTQAGTGSTTLSGNSSTFTGAVAVTAGTLVLQNIGAVGSGTAGTTISSGAALRLDGGLAPTSSTGAGNGTLTLAGTGVGGTGALVGANSNNRWTGNLALAADAMVSTSGSGYLALGLTTPAWNRATNDPTHTPYDTGYQDTTNLSLGSNTLTLKGTVTGGGDAIYVNARMTGTGNVVIDMTNPADVARYTANVNTYTGSTTIKNGTLALNTTYNTYPGDTVNPGYFGINGPLTIGDGTGAANTARYTTGTGTQFSELMNYTTAVTMNSDGQMSLNAAQTVAGLTFNGGKIDLGTAGGLYLNGTVTVNASAGNTATITGAGTSTLSLTIHQGPSPVGNANRAFNIVGGVGNTSDLTLSALITNGSITKTGIGTMSIITSNSGGYEGTTTINNGILNIQHGDALGQASNNTATATTVNSGGTLQLSNVANGNFTVNSGEQIYLNGTGYLTNGALENLVGNNTVAGSTFLTTDARIQSDSGVLTLSGTMNSASNSNLDVRGSGDTTISGTIGTGTGGITKNGTGTLILSGNNTYGGTTTISSGVLSLQNSQGLGGLGITTVASGAALYLDSTANGNLLGGDATTISGTGIGGTGAIRNVLGSNNYTGQITLAGASLVTANTATTLTLSGGTTGTQDLTVGTTAQNGNVVISGAMTNGTGVLTKNGSGDLAFGKSTGISGTVGLTHLNGGTLTVGLDSGTQSILNTSAIDSALGTTLKIGSSGKVLATYGTNATIFGTIDKISAAGGTFEKAGAGTLTFATSFNFAGNLILSGGTLALINGASVTFGNIYITANTTIDFGSGTSTILSSANLFIAAGVQVSVINWVNNGAGGSDDIWYATNGFNSFTGTPAAPSVGTSAVLDATNTAPENQITFTGIAPAGNTSWVSVQGGQYYDHEIRPIPEPSTYGAIFFGGCLGLFGWRRYRRALAARR